MKFDVKTYPGYNTRDGLHPTELVFSVTGTGGAMVWRLSTGVSPTGHWPSMDPNGPLLEGVNTSSPMSMGVAAHSELTMQNASAESYSISESCEFLEGRACVCDYSRNLTEYMSAFACEGFEGVRRMLEAEYIGHYGKDP